MLFKSIAFFAFVCIAVASPQGTIYGKAAKDPNACVQACRKADSFSGSYAGRGMYGYCESKCAGEGTQAKWLQGAAKL
jgi:hypothetical protein